jgi:hypothetical protein
MGVRVAEYPEVFDRAMVAGCAGFKPDVVTYNGVNAIGELLDTAVIKRGGGVTAKITAALVTPPEIAVIWVVPVVAAVARPVTTPIVATLVALLVQVKTTPGMTFPLASFAVAEN